MGTIYLKIKGYNTFYRIGATPPGKTRNGHIRADIMQIDKISKYEYYKNPSKCRFIVNRIPKNGYFHALKGKSGWFGDCEIMNYLSGFKICLI